MGAKDLAKKNRKLTMQLERERARASKLEFEIEKNRTELSRFSHHNLSPKKVVEPMSTQKTIDGIDDDKPAADKVSNEISAKHSEDMAKVKQKLAKSQNEALKHKETIKKLTLALKKEIGDNNKDIADIIRDGGTWKGRSEKIAILTSKLKEKKRELELFNDIGLSKKQKSRVDENDEHRKRISQISSERMEQFENAQLEMEKLRELNSELKEVLKAKNCRITGCETNLSSMRKKLSFFVEKSKTDDTLVDTLQTQLNEQLKLKKNVSKKEKLLKKNTSDICTMSATMNEQNLKIKILNESIDEMKERICNLTQKRTDDFVALSKSFDDNDKLYQIELLRAENEKQKDIIATYKKSQKNLQKKLSRKSSPRGSETNRSTKSKTMKASQLKEKMDAMTQEQQLIKASYLSIIEGKEQEIEICRTMLKTLQDTHQRSVDEMKTNIEQMKKALLNK